ncbi:MAG: M23 family metallopeptidase [Alphaproteobacteria bacterium]
MLIFRIISLIAVGVAGWIIGSVYPAPPELIAKINPEAIEMRARSDLSGLDWHRLQGLVTREQFDRMSQQAQHLAAQAGALITVEHETDQDSTETDLAVPPSMPTPAVAPASGATPASAGANAVVGGRLTAFDSTLALCPRMTITNSPAADATGHVAHYQPVVDVQGVQLAIDPTHNTCLSSGFGTRSGKLHKGIDFYSATGGPIFAPANGTIVEMKYRDDYGNMLLIDHGHGVYTRYAHLSSFQPGLAVGGQVHTGDQIGLMGNTASYPVPIHLHYELLLGDYNNPKQSFGLTPHSPFEYHAG